MTSRTFKKEKKMKTKMCDNEWGNERNKRAGEESGERGKGASLHICHFILGLSTR
jgi:hypothetical protein